MSESQRPPAPTVRKGQGSVQLTKDAFKERFAARFHDPAFVRHAMEVDRLANTAWDGYEHNRKSPRASRAGAGFADPDYQLSDEWRAARDAIAAAEARRRNSSRPPQILLICGSPRSDQTCPGEISKTFRLCGLARDLIAGEGLGCDFLDLSRLTSEYGRVIYPCKGCVSTAMPLCHWPCSCYPNHSLGQTGDWMNEIYPRWAAADGVMIVTPVHWGQAPTVLKLMIDRLVCADGGNPDPTSTHGKDPQRAKELEMRGWSYPRHLAGRAFSVVVHADAEGVESVREGLVNWLTGMKLVQAGAVSVVGRYVGYYEPYATSHDALDRDGAFQEETRNAARALVAEVRLIRAGRVEPDRELKEPRPK